MGRAGRLKSAAFFAAVFVFSGCVSIMEAAGRVLDGSAFAERRVSVFRGSGMEITEVQAGGGERYLLVSLDQFPQATLRGPVQDSGGGLFFFTALDFLGGNAHGWNEFRLDIAAFARLCLGEEFARLELGGPVEAVQISSARIHRFDTRITGGEAVANLRDRRDRILSLVAWMHERGGGGPGVASDAGEFNGYWTPLLFPEAVSRRRRPDGWQKEGDLWTRAEGVRWNASYTKRIFPEELRAVRDSGTLLRDWEEALPWIFMEYNWQNMEAQLARENILARVR